MRLFSDELSVAYRDYQARLRWFPSANETLSLLGFGAYDLLTRERDGSTQTLYGVTFHRLDARYERVHSDGRAEAGVVLGWDRSAVRDGQATVEDLSLRVRVRVEQQLEPGLVLKLGADAGHTRYSAELARVDDPEARADLAQRYSGRSDSVAGAYAGLRVTLARGILVEPGVRADAYYSRWAWVVGVDPRVLAEFELTPALTLVHGLGLAHQPPADPLPEPGIDPPLAGGLQTAVQSSAGVRWTLPKDLSLQATLFQSLLLHLSDSAGNARLEQGESND